MNWGLSLYVRLWLGRVTLLRAQHLGLPPWFLLASLWLQTSNVLGACFASDKRLRRVAAPGRTSPHWTDAWRAFWALREHERYFRKIFSIGFPLAISSTSLSR